MAIVSNAESMAIRVGSESAWFAPPQTDEDNQNRSNLTVENLSLLDTSRTHGII